MMCLAVPGRITRINGDKATVDYDGEVRTAGIVDMELKMGDYVIVQAGVVLQKVAKKEAEESLKILRSLK